MYAIPIKIGTELRHLRYPFGIITDIDYILPEGFFSIFDMEADIPTCHLLLYAGLCHEGVTYEQAGMMLVDDGAAHDMITLVGYWKKITDALTFDEWISIGANTQGEPGIARTLSEEIDDMEKEAIGKLDISLSDFYGITPREFNLLREKKGIADNHRTGLICATLANALVPKKHGGVWRVSDFVGTGESVKVQTAEEQAAVLSAAFEG
ncbi:MAG: hypothetical protein WC294_06445 [Methanoregula sp.]|jgi:hypothetical protein